MIGLTNSAVLLHLAGLEHPAGLERITLGLDGVLFAVGIVATFLAWQLLSPRIGHRVAFACGGLILLSLVHFTETAGDLTTYLTGDLAEIVHRILVLVGFLWLLLGLWQVAREMLRQTEEKDALIAELEAAKYRYAQLASVIEATTDFVGTADVDGNALYVNAAGRRMVGVPEDEDISRTRIADYHPPWAATLVAGEGVPAALRDGVWAGETALLSRDGREIPVSQLVIAHKNAAGDLEFLSTIARDITERKQFERRLMELVSILEATPDWVVTTDVEGTLSYANRAARTFLGVPASAGADALVGVSVLGSMPAWAVDLLATEGLPRALLQGSWTGETALLSPAGREIPTSHAMIVHRNAEGTVQFVSSIVRDISLQKQLEADLRHQAFHDPLTGLANRTRFIERLDHALVRARRTGDGVALLFCDLDHFKSVNDSHGHTLGDQLLIKVGEQLASLVREGDTVARLGGDEFAILLEGDTDAPYAEASAQQLIEAFRAPFAVDGRDVFAHASVGVALATGGEDAAELLRRADLAMYTAKANGKNRFEVFDEGVQSAMGERLKLFDDLQGAVERQEFVLHYQPTISIGTGEVLGVEALVRWQHPERGLIPPLAFIPIAEESGVIVPLGRWILAEACRQLTIWQQTRPGSSMQSVAVNVSARQIHDPGFVQDVAAALVQSGLDAQCLTLEITESATMQDANMTIAVLGELKKLGVRLAIDDFGTGYSSLSYLRQFPFDVLKIDKSFVDAMGAGDTKLTSAIVNIAKSLGLEIVAEGVEQRGQLDRLRTLDCDIAQGYYFSEPITADQIDALLNMKTAADAA
jgi:diguanylate cyclase (GGDEF)-like protein/PAS domain S-box-containing protein